MSRGIQTTALLLTALTAIQLLSACSGGGNAAKTPGAETSAAETEPAETTWAVHDDLDENLNYSGKSFNLYHAHGVGRKDYWVEEETGDVMNDATYQRNRMFEERLGIKFNYIEAGFATDGASQNQATAQIESYILAGDETNHVYIHVQHTGMPGKIAQGYFVDWNTVPNIDFSKDYWYQKCLSDINYGNKVFAMTGAYNLTTLTGSNVLYFNKNLLEEANLEFPYQLVLDGKWTVDKWKTYLTALTRDLNGDGVIEQGVDQTAYWGWGYEQYPAFFMGLGGDVAVKDEKTGKPVLNILNERTTNLIAKMKDIFAMDGCGVEWSTYGIFNTAFNSGLLGFVHANLNAAAGDGFRAMEDDFGFVPYPKLDEAQASYNCRVQNTTCLTYIPITNKELEFTGACLEAFAAVSYNVTVPAFFDVVLTVKAARDTESEKMVPIIRDSASFYDEAITGFSVRSAVDSDGLASYWASVEGTVTKAMEDNILSVYFTD